MFRESLPPPVEVALHTEAGEVVALGYRRTTISLTEQNFDVGLLAAQTCAAVTFPEMVAAEDVNITHAALAQDGEALVVRLPHPIRLQAGVPRVVRIPPGYIHIPTA